MMIVILLVGIYLIVSSGVPGASWGFLRGPYSGTGSWLKTHPTFGRLSGVSFIASVIIYDISLMFFLLLISIGFVFLIIGLVVDSHSQL
ncbi:MAG: hypothetical protein P9L92_17810 [Candidatus Electryonea clarkiae]|nr:hypothetical protein [Candidatus Electryonea clarkiae]MDP8287764.1 hypothetical protein [Candidatus Electryonea clarkiae]